MIVIDAPKNAAVGVLDHPPPLPAQGPAWTRTTHANPDGDAILDGVPKGRVRVIVIAPGFLRYEAVVDTAEPKSLKIFVTPDPDGGFRTVVEGRPPTRAHATSEVLTREELRTMPGSQGDPLRGLQNLPGVARTPAGLGLLILRGAGPNQSRVFLGGHAIPRAFHVLSIASVFPAEIIESLEFVPSNFDAAYGNATGGIVVIEPRTGRRDGVHGFAELDLAAASTLVEGKLKRGSFVVSAQRGYIDGVLAAADAVTQRVTGNSDSLLRPSYYDYQALLDYPLRRGAELAVRVFGSGDRIRDSGSSPLGPAALDFRASFHRLDASIRTRKRGVELWWTPSVRIESALFSQPQAANPERRQDYVLSTRAELRKRFSKRFSLVVGTDLEVDTFITRTADFNNLDAQGLAALKRERGTQSSIGVYTTADLRYGPLTVRPGLRATAYTVEERAANSVDPRVTAYLDPTPNWRVSLGLGKYSQLNSAGRDGSVALVGQETDLEDGSAILPSIFARFDPRVQLAPPTGQLTTVQALQASLGVKRSFDAGYSLKATGFWREQDNGSPVPQGPSLGLATGTRAGGLEVLARKRLTRKLYGWVAYTLMWARVRYIQRPSNFAQASRPSNYDQRHNLIFLGSYILPKRWRIGGRFRVVSGYPITPVVGSIEVGSGRYAAIFGPRNSDRLAVFHQLDVRVDKTWIRKRIKITGYIDIQNVYNRQNPEAAVYGPDYREQVGVVGVPIFPSLGFRIDY